MENLALQKKKQSDENKERDILYGAKIRARKYNLPFDLSLEDIVIPDVCPVLGISIVKNLNIFQIHPVKN